MDTFFASIVLVCVFLLGILRLRDISEPYLLILIILLLCCVYLCCVFTSFDLLVQDSLCASWIWLTTLVGVLLLAPSMVGLLVSSRDILF